MEKIFFNGQILTMENQDLKSAIFIKNGLIKAIGNDTEILNFKSKDTELIDLKGKTLMPSFIDPHSHITAFASTFALVNLSEAKSFTDIQNALLAFKNNNEIANEKWIVGFGYDHNNLIENAHPTKDILDSISTINPILITHASGHMGVVNSNALKLFKITSKTKNPEGGVIGRTALNEPNGYLEENAFMTFSKLVEKPTLEDMFNLIQKAEKTYASYGITTTHDGMVTNTEFYLLQEMSKNKKLTLDIVGYVDINNCSSIIDTNPKFIKKYINHFKIGGFKVFQDGSPQGRTAWLTKPYEGDDKNYLGYPIYEDSQIYDFIKLSLEKNIQIISHCNGDAASDQFINSYKKVLTDNTFENTIRPVMIHAQTVRHDQLEEMKNLNMIPSFFIAHISRWGDTHIKNLGMERANHISPAGYALNLNIPYTFHQDTPVILPDMMHTIWTAVNRTTSNGVLLGEDERISVFDALKGITINAAYQYFEEDTKGTLTKGKIADLVILDKNPLEVSSSELKNIKILETLKNGVTIFKKL